MRKTRSLAELLVVAFVVVCVTGLVVPLVAGMESPYTAKCAANGKQIANALLLYMADYDGRFPSSVGAWPEPSRTNTINYLMSITWTYTWDATKPNQVWNAAGQASWRHVQLRDYIKDDSVWVCPYPRTLYAERYAYGFRMSWMLRSPDDFVNGDRGFNNVDGVGLTVEDVEKLDLKGETKCGPRLMPPHKKIMAMCYAIGEWGNKNIGNPPGVYPWIFPSYSHEGGSNFAYADGHVSWRKMGQGWAPIGYTNLAIDGPPSGLYSVVLSPRAMEQEEQKAVRSGGSK